MAANERVSLNEIESRVCDTVAKQLRIPRDGIHPGLRLIQDLHCDSLDAVELFMELEDAFGIDLPEKASNPIYKSVFTRNPFRLSDLAELVYLQQGSQRQPDQGFFWSRHVPAVPLVQRVPFTQLGGIASEDLNRTGKLHEPLGLNAAGFETYRRKTDGMICVLVPAGKVAIGSTTDEASGDEKPRHEVSLTRFLMDGETVSTTAYCRFLNSIGAAEPSVLSDWFVLGKDDQRCEHELLRQVGGRWKPFPGTEYFPMVLVSWHGANAYALWANRREWREHRDDAQSECFLPSEAQWEYAARGREAREWPWGDEPPTLEQMRYGRHRRGATYQASTLPMAEVNEGLGMSPFGLTHMAGNVWQWCRDWYEPGFYSTAEASMENAVNRRESGIRSERGGSWVGPAFLCRSSYRRGRVPIARGRCLGFRCIGEL